jgi:hypothetical protein
MCLASGAVAVFDFLQRNRVITWNLFKSAHSGAAADPAVNGGKQSKDRYLRQVCESAIFIKTEQLVQNSAAPLAKSKKL